MIKNVFAVTVLGATAFFCLSGQIARKEVEEVLSTQCAINEVELQKAQEDRSQVRKSAAKKAMEDTGQTTYRKSAAKRVMEGL